MPYLFLCLKKEELEEMCRHEPNCRSKFAHVSDGVVTKKHPHNKHLTPKTNNFKYINIPKIT